MELVRLLVANERRRLGAYVGIVVLVALVGAVAMAALAGARRTASAFERHLEATDASDVAINIADYRAAHREALARLPGVVGTRAYVGVLGGPVTREEPDVPLGSTSSLELLASLDGRFFDQDRPAIVDGRLPDRDRSEEVFVNRTLARATGLGAGDRLLLAVGDPETYEFLDERIPITVTGVGTTSEEVTPADVDALQRVILTPAFIDEHPELIAYTPSSFTYTWAGLRLRPGTDLDEVEAAWEESAAARSDEASTFRYLRTSTLAGAVQDSVRPQVVGLLAFGALASALAVAVSVQAVRRTIRAADGDTSAMRAFGTGRVTANAGVVVALAGALVVGAGLALLGAIALSPLAPVGAVRAIEPRPGATLDLVVMAPAALLLVLVGLAVAMFTARRDAVARVASALDTGLGSRLPLVAGTGVRMALGRRGSAARSALAGAVLATLAVVTMLVLGVSVRHLADTPRLFGAGFDVALQVGAGYSEYTPGELDDFLARRADPDVDGWATVSYGRVTIDGTAVPALGVDAGRGVIGPSIAAGRAPTAEDELVLGESTLEQIGAGVGDEVDVEGRTMTVVGRAVLPALGQATGDHPSLGVGAWLSGEGLRALSPALPDGRQLGASAVLLDLGDGAESAPVTNTLIADLEGDPEGWGLSPEDVGEPGDLLAPFSPPRPPELVGTDGSAAAPVALSALLATGGLAALGFALLASVRARRRELAMLRALGWSRRQVAGAVAVQATTTVAIGLLIGVPLGAALGNLLWRAFADQLGVLAETAAPVLAIAGLGAGTALLAVGLAVLLSRLATRDPAAVALRAG